ncbi:MAG: NUMOD3 domain-containing DNA-binding protein [Candidatus Micrarchaeota archaeon]
MLGRKQSEESIAKMKESRGTWPTGKDHPMFGKNHSIETRKQMTKSHTGVPLSENHRGNIGLASEKVWAAVSKERREEWVAKMSFSATGRIMSPESIAKGIKAKKGKRCSPGTEFKKGMIPWQKGRSPSTESINKNRESNIKRVTQEMRDSVSKRMKSLWEDPEHAKKCLSFNSPNKQEIKLMGILDVMYPGEWKFVGDGQITIAGKFPDFINVNGQKKIIELYGEFFHKGDNPEDRAKVFEPYGYETLIIWGKELTGIEKLKSKLRAFCGEIQK